MWCTGKLSSNKRGAGSIIGAVFILLILLTGFTYYFLNVNVTEDYNKILQDMQELDLKRNKENIEFTSVSITADEKLNMAVRNTGSYQIHLIWLGVFNKTSTPETQQYFSENTYVDPGEAATEIGSSITVAAGSQYVIQLVTELGNVFNSDLYPIKITGPNTISFNFWTDYTIQIPSTTVTSVPIYFSIYANGSSVTFFGIPAISNPDWLHTDANGEYTVTLRSSNVAGETFVLYVMAGSLVGQKRITQESV